VRGRREESGGGSRWGPAGDGGGMTGFPRGDGGSGRRWQGCIYLPYSQYTKSRGRIATRQIVVAGKARSSPAAAGAASRGREGKQNRGGIQMQKPGGRGGWTWEEEAEADGDGDTRAPSALARLAIVGRRRKKERRKRRDSPDVPWISAARVAAGQDGGTIGAGNRTHRE